MMTNNLELSMTGIIRKDHWFNINPTMLRCSLYIYFVSTFVTAPKVGSVPFTRIALLGLHIGLVAADILFKLKQIRGHFDLRLQEVLRVHVIR
jgi:hypothetical protein